MNNPELWISLFYRQKKLYQLILRQEFIQNIASDQIFISSEMVFQITWLHALQ